MHSVLIQCLGEFLGDFIIILFGNGVVASVSLNKTKAQGTGWLAIALGWGFAVLFAVMIGGVFSPAASFNPALTLAMAMIGKFSWNLVLPFILAQFLGAMVGQLFVWLFFYPHWAETKDSATILGCFSTGPAIKHTPSNIFGEAVGTAILLIGVLAFGQNKLVAGVSPMMVGWLIMAIGLSLGATTGYAINPARDWGPRIMHSILPIANKGKSGWDYALVPLVGPILGGALGALLYQGLLGLLH